MLSTPQQALLTAQAFSNGKPVIRANGEPAIANLTTTTDCPCEALGEVVGYALSMAWRTGLDPVKDQVKIEVTFT
jgi:hypothetical protein